MSCVTPLFSYSRLGKLGFNDILGLKNVKYSRNQKNYIVTFLYFWHAYIFRFFVLHQNN